jgi:hypothetical protein
MPHDVVSSSMRGLQVTFFVVDHGRARRLASLHTLALGLNYLMRSSLGPPSFSALADNEDRAVNLDGLPVP